MDWVTSWSIQTMSTPWTPAPALKSPSCPPVPTLCWLSFAASLELSVTDRFCRLSSSSSAVHCECEPDGCHGKLRFFFTGVSDATWRRWRTAVSMVTELKLRWSGPVGPAGPRAAAVSCDRQLLHAIFDRCWRQWLCSDWRDGKLERIGLSTAEGDAFGDWGGVCRW